MACPLCGYNMEPFDKECRKCHGKGLAAPTPPPVPVEATPVLRIVPPAPDSQVPSPNGMAASAAGAILPYFFAARDSAFGKPLLYRVYADADALLFIEAGIFHIGSVRSLKEMYGETGNGPSATQKATGRAVMVGSMNAGAAGAVGGLAVGGIMWALGKHYDKGTAERAKVLDAMTPDDLRREAKQNKTGAYMTQTNTSDVELRPSGKKWLTDSPDMAGYLSFVCSPKGKWKMTMLTLTDSQFAAQELRRILGVERVNVLFPF